jgi:hypothetical protein
MDAEQRPANSDLYVFGTGQVAAAPGLKPEETTLFVTPEKHALAEAIANGLEVPIVWQHGGLEDGQPRAPGADGHVHVPSDRKTGRVMHAMVDQHDKLLLVAQLFWDAPETADIRARLERGERLGFTLGTNLMRGRGVVADKRLDHVGITDAPAFGEEERRHADGTVSSTGTWLHLNTLTPDTLVEHMQRFLHEPGMYVPTAVRARYDAAAQRLRIKQDRALRSEPVTLGASASVPTMASTVSDAINTALGAPAPQQPPAQQQQPPAQPAQAAPAPVKPAMATDEFERRCQVLEQQVQAYYGKEPEVLSIEDLNRARTYQKEYSELLKEGQRELWQLQPTSTAALLRLSHIVNLYEQNIKKEIGKLKTPEEREQAARSLAFGNTGERLTANYVLGGATKEMLNARDAELKLQAERAELARKEQTAREQKLRDDMEVEYKKRAKAQEDELEELRAAKRARLTAEAVVAAEKPALAAAPEPVSIGAGGFSLPNQGKFVDDLFVRSFLTYDGKIGLDRYAAMQHLYNPSTDKNLAANLAAVNGYMGIHKDVPLMAYSGETLAPRPEGF